MLDNNILSGEYRDIGILLYFLVHEKVAVLIVSFSFFAL